MDSSVDCEKLPLKGSWAINSNDSAVLTSRFGCDGSLRLGHFVGIPVCNYPPVGEASDLHRDQGISRSPLIVAILLPDAVKPLRSARFLDGCNGCSG